MDGNFTIASACGDFTTFSCRLLEVRRQDRLRQQHRELPNHCFYRHDGGPCGGYGVWASELDGGERVSWEQGFGARAGASRLDAWARVDVHERCRPEGLRKPFRRLSPEQERVPKAV